MTGLKRSWRQALACFAIPVLVAALVIVLRLVGGFQSIELSAYDLFLRHLRSQHTSVPVVVVRITEADINPDHMGYPPSDDQLAVLLENILKQGPLGIGIDVIRDRHIEPNTGDRLDKLLSTYDNIILAKTLGSDDSPGVGPPEVLRGRPYQFGITTVPVDPDGRIRRGLAFNSEGRQSISSFSWQLANLVVDPTNESKVSASRILELLKLSKYAGPYALQDTAGGQFFLDFAGSEAIQERCTLTCTNVLSQIAVRPTAFSNAIVLIGYDAETIKDSFSTPISQRTPGVLIHANAVHQLVRILRGERPLDYCSEIQESAYITGCSIFGGGVALLALLFRPGVRTRRGGRAIWIFVLKLSISTALIWVIAAFAFSRNFFIPVVPPIVALLLSAALLTLFVLFSERDDRAAERALTEMHIPKAIINEILKDKPSLAQAGRLPPQKMVATVLFTDLQGFAGTAEGMPPEKLLKWLNQYFEEICGAVERDGTHGFVSKFNGDQIMALFGPPFVRNPAEIAADARAAIECALEMRSRFAGLTSKWRDHKLPITKMRVGINTGLLVAGSLGGAGRLEYTVIGDTVNTASRLESFKKELMDPQTAPDGCRILISGATRDLLENQYELQPLGEHPLTGKRDLISVFAVLGLREPSSTIMLEPKPKRVKGAVA